MNEKMRAVLCDSTLGFPLSVHHSSFIIHHSPLRIEFQSYSEAYGDDFEDCRRRVPDLTKLRRLTGLEARWGLDEIIAELVEQRT